MQFHEHQHVNQLSAVHCINKIVTCFDFMAQVERGVEPRCVFWNTRSRQWEERGVERVAFEIVDTGEIKSYQVSCTAEHATAFAVTLEVDTQVCTCALRI